MRIYCPTNFEDMAPYAEDWDRLAVGVPFRSWTWLSHWWRHYGPRTESEATRTRLAVICVFDESDTLVGIAPWYLDTSTLQGRVLRPMGSGEVCSDYLGVLCQPAREDAVLEVMADYLIGCAKNGGTNGPVWDLLALDGVETNDQTLSTLISYLAIGGCNVHRRNSLNCWRLALPTDWETYYASLESRNFRRDLRRLVREYVDTGRAKLNVVQQFDELPQAMDILVNLHQRRRTSLGQPGCFASPRFSAFYWEVVPALLRGGQLQLDWLEVDGQPVACEYQLLGGGVLYGYLAGVDPTAMNCEPGKLHNMMSVQQAITSGYRAIDYLRGDEPYKKRFGAQPIPLTQYRIVPDRTLARMRHNVWLAGRNVKNWVKRGVKREAAEAAVAAPSGD